MSAKKLPYNHRLPLSLDGDFGDHSGHVFNGVTNLSGQFSPYTERVKKCDLVRTEDLPELDYETSNETAAHHLVTSNKDVPLETRVARDAAWPGKIPHREPELTDGTEPYAKPEALPVTRYGQN
jgi:hypothetical protein